MTKIGNIFSKLKLKQKVRVLFLAVLVVYIVALFLVFAIVLRKQVYDYAMENNKQTTLTIGNNLTTEVEKVNNFSRLLLTNTGITRYLDVPLEESADAYSSAIVGIYEVQNAYPEASSVFVFRNDGEYLSVGKGVTKVDKDLFFSEPYMQEINELDGAYVLRVSGDGAFTTSYKDKVVSLIRSINDVDSLEKKGVLVVNFPITVLNETYEESIGGDKHFAYLDHNGEIVCADEDSPMFDKIKVGEEKFGEWMENGFLSKTVYCYYKVPKTSFTLLCYEKIAIFENVSHGVMISIAFLILLTVLVLVGIGAFITVYITNPLQKLVDAMASIKQGWLRRVSIKCCNDEIGQLKDSYNDMLVETNALIDQLVEKEKSIKKAEIDILQEQIKPHFLYNTIEMIASLSIDGSRDEIYDALETLGSFYRQFLSKGSTEVTLETELEIIKDYIKIEKLRYGDIFDAEYEIEEQCLNMRLPKLILQPLVENSIYHGIRLKGERGIIRISAYDRNKARYLEVYDMGIGMTKEELEHVMDDNNKSFGFKRTIERFQYFAGNRGGYKVESEEGKYTRITLIVRESEEDKCIEL